MSQTVEEIDPSKKKDPRLMWISQRYNALYTQKQWEVDFNNDPPLPGQVASNNNGINLYRFVNKPERID